MPMSRFWRIMPAGHRKGTLSSIRMRSMDDVLTNHGNVGPGFDLMRIALAFIILYFHCWFIAAGGASWLGPEFGHAAINAPGATTSAVMHSGSVLWQKLHDARLALVFNHTDTHYGDILVPMFFALSGFLVTGSAFRTRLIRSFLTFRILRIVPALFTEVTLSALFLGPLLTVYPLAKYFSDEKFFAYFGNIFGFVHYELPGLFLSNPAPIIVNGNLWTLPPEFYCYLITAAMLVSGILFDRFAFSILFLISSLFFFVANLFVSFDDQITGHHAPIIVYYFFCGSMLYHWREYVPYNRWLFIGAIGAVYLHYMSSGGHLFIFPVFVTYITIFLGLTNLPRIPVIQSGDYSYGVYLYGFPITQALVNVAPQLRGHGIWVAATAIPLTFAFAGLSWHLVEKPMLALKRRFGPRTGVVAKKPAEPRLKRA